MNKMGKGIIGVVRELKLCSCFTTCCSQQRKEKERITEERIVTENVEGENHRTCFDTALEILTRLQDELHQIPDLKNPIETTQLDLRFFKMFFWSLVYWDDEARNDLHLQSVIRTMGSELRQTVMSSHFVEKIQTFKPDARRICIILLGGAFKCKSYNNTRCSVYARETGSFIGFILENLELLNLKLDQVAPLKKQIGFIQGKLKLFRDFVHLVSQWKTEDERLGTLLVHTQTWANHISFLTCLYWIDEIDESQACTMVTMLSELMKKTMPYTPEVITLYLDVLAAVRYENFETKEIHLLTQLNPRYVDFLLENLEDVEILREGLLFLLSFAGDPSKEDTADKKLIWTQINAVISEVPSVICSIHLDDMSRGNPISKTKYSDLLRRIHRLKPRELDVLIPLSSESKFPTTNAIGFLDFLLQNLKKFVEAEVNFVARVKHHAQMLWEELASVRPFLQNIMELKNEREEIKDLWTQIINVVYNADYVIKLTSIMDFSTWETYFSNIIEDIKLIKIEVKKIEDDHIYCNKKLIAKMQSNDSQPPQATISKIGVVIGFKEDARSIIDYLRGGRKDLTIISISGMPGQGKTTLARRIYSDPVIQYDFHKIAWCYVSKEFNIRELLIQILSDVSNVDVGLIIKLEIQDILELLRKSLKRQRYLIVMDDIWDVDVWHKVEGSFPDDKNGSRIMFTSRNHNLASQAKPNSISHPLRLFSDEESWELMKIKLFPCGGCPPDFLMTGKQIAIYCKGLPLAVVLIAALLGRTEQKLDLWNRIAENLKSHLAREGCMHIIELSYKYLPDSLKPCFLYFGAFPRGRNIRAKKLKLLWIAEGFINENEMQCSEDLAKEYLDNLVSLSLVVVTERSSLGGIKTCNIHDLLYDLCLEKAVEEHFLHSADVSTVIDQCYFSPQKYNHHRLCIGTSSHFTQPRSLCTQKELPTSHVHSLLWSLGYSRKQTYESFSCFLKSFSVLTVLDLEELFLECFRFPMVILFIVHLRYLALRGSIERIPPSIADLWNLETLIVRAPQLEAPLPDTMWKMRNLKHIDIAHSRLQFEDFERNNSFAAYNIETLSAPILCYDHQTEEFLKRLPKLRKLHCYCKKGFHPSWFSMFGALKQLEALHIGNGGFLFHNTHFEKLPTFNFPENLKKLTLSQLKLPWSAISTIGKLPNLEVLKLLYWACQGTTWDLEDGEFPKLRFLKLSDLPIEEINISSCDDPFPYLEELLVRSCHSLELASSFGDICTLKVIRVVSSHKAARSARRIFKQQRDMGNDSIQVFVKTFSNCDTMDIDHDDFDEGAQAEEEEYDDNEGGEREEAEEP